MTSIKITFSEDDVVPQQVPKLQNASHINNHQTMYREKEPYLHLHLLRNYTPLKSLSCPLYNINTVENILVNLCTHINNHQTMYREKEPYLHLHLLRNYAPLKIFLGKSCPLYNFNTVKNIFMKQCTYTNHHQAICREKEP